MGASKVYFALVLTALPALAFCSLNGTSLLASATGYSQTEALIFAYLSAAANCIDESLEDWNCGAACAGATKLGSTVSSVTQVFSSDSSGMHNAGGFAYVGRTSSRCLVVFAGTHDSLGWVADFASVMQVPAEALPCGSGPSPCKVGVGFHSLYASMRGKVYASLYNIGCIPGRNDSKISAAGHSLGSALGQMMLYDLATAGYSIASGYFFGSPRVGNAAWAAAFEAALAGVPIFRVTYKNDPIALVPFKFWGFVHVGTEVWYQGDARTTEPAFCTGDSTADPSCSSYGLDHSSAAWAAVNDGLWQCLFHFGNCPHLQYMSSLMSNKLWIDACPVNAPTVLSRGSPSANGTAASPRPGPWAQLGQGPCTGESWQWWCQNRTAPSLEEATTTIAV